jgi:hydroxyethylthiazole kinase-like sugar kinase family protein
LVYSDREPLSVGITPAMTQAMTDFDDMRRIAKTVLVNWLAAQNQPQTS